jgi:hypothetical protein
LETYAEGKAELKQSATANMVQKDGGGETERAWDKQPKNCKERNIIRQK